MFDEHTGPGRCGCPRLRFNCSWLFFRNRCEKITPGADIGRDSCEPTVGIVDKGYSASRPEPAEQIRVVIDDGAVPAVALGMK